jgi:hypothetical protein
MKIYRTQTIERGYGTCTAVLFKQQEVPEGYYSPSELIGNQIPANCNGWDYWEVIYGNGSDYQRSCHALSVEDAKKLIGRDTGEISQLGFQVLRGKWHRPRINTKGKVIELKC